MMTSVISSRTLQLDQQPYKASQFWKVSALLVLLGMPAASLASTIVGVADAPLEATFYSDASCLLAIDAFVQHGKTVIDADVDASGSRMFIHCDTEDGRRLTLLARGDALDTETRAPLLNRTEIGEGDDGMLAWLTRPGVHYTDDAAPRRYVIGGSVKLRKSPPVDAVGTAPNSSAHSFASVNGVLEPIVKSEAQSMQLTPTEESTPEDSTTSESAEQSSVNVPSVDTSGVDTSGVDTSGVDTSTTKTPSLGAANAAELGEEASVAE